MPKFSYSLKDNYSSCEKALSCLAREALLRPHFRRLLWSSLSGLQSICSTKRRTLSCSTKGRVGYLFYVAKNIIVLFYKEKTTNFVLQSEDRLFYRGKSIYRLFVLRSRLQNISLVLQKEDYNFVLLITCSTKKVPGTSLFTDAYRRQNI